MKVNFITHVELKKYMHIKLNSDGIYVNTCIILRIRLAREFFFFRNTRPEMRRHHQPLLRSDQRQWIEDVSIRYGVVYVCRFVRGAPVLRHLFGASIGIQRARTKSIVKCGASSLWSWPGPAPPLCANKMSIWNWSQFRDVDRSRRGSRIVHWSHLTRMCVRAYRLLGQRSRLINIFIRSIYIFIRSLN